MQPKNISQEPDLGFLESFKNGSDVFPLPSGDQVQIRKYLLTFKPWEGPPISDTYNHKAVINWKGEPVFAELAILRLFQENGWDGVWVDSYRRKYRTALPEKKPPVELPKQREAFLESIRAKIGRSGGCWDVFVCKGDQVLFAETKRQGKDAIQKSQIQWLGEALKSGLNSENFLMVEWMMTL